MTEQRLWPEQMRATATPLVAPGSAADRSHENREINIFRRKEKRGTAAASYPTRTSYTKFNNNQLNRMEIIMKGHNSWFLFSVEQPRRHLAAMFERRQFPQ